MTLKKRVLAGLAVSVVGATGLAACGGDDSDGGDDAAEITWAVDSGWESWNQFTADGNNSYIAQATLPSMRGIEYDPDAQPIYPEAIYAEEPKMVSEEPLTVEYNLNPDAQWNDGEPFRVEDMIFVWHATSGLDEHCDQEKCAPASTDWASNVASIEETADSQITVTYVDGYVNPEWPLYGVDGEAGYMVPSHVIEAEGFTDWQTDPAVMGEAADWLTNNPPTWSIGPYTPVKAEAGKFIEFEPNENYQGSTEPSLDKLTIRVVEGGIENVVTELRQGTIDGVWATTFSNDDLAPLDESDQLAYETYQGSVWSHIDFNLDRITDVELRKAVFTALDREDMIARAYPGFDDLNPKNHYIFSEGSEYYEDVVGPTGQGSADLDGARSILEEAGYTWDGDDNLINPDGEAVAFNFRYPQSNTIRKTFAELSQSYLAEIGIDLEVSPFPDAELGPVLSEGDFDLITYGWSGSANFTVAPQQYWKTGSDSNYGNLSNPEIDEVLTTVTATNDIDAAAAAATEASKLVVEEAYVLPIVDSPIATLYNTKIQGLEANGNTQSGALWNLEEWSVE